jgi:ABC-type uncharacterized transport system substrate-binding protein
MPTLNPKQAREIKSLGFVCAINVDAYESLGCPLLDSQSRTVTTKSASSSYFDGEKLGEAAKQIARTILGGDDGHWNVAKLTAP